MKLTGFKDFPVIVPVSGDVIDRMFSDYSVFRVLDKTLKNCTLTTA